MKKIISNILIYILFITSCIVVVNDTTTVNATDAWPSGPGIYGTAGVLIEASTGTVLYEKKCHTKMYPASITKIMTALLTIENCKMDEVVTFSENAINGLEYGDANIGCSIGEQLTVKDCLYALMLQSANEVATALGEHISGSTKAFAELMNQRAKEAGATDTHFTNANGLHNPNHYVTAYDMAMITRAATQYTAFNDIVNTTTYTIKKNNKRKEDATAIQRHKMVWQTSGYYYDGIIGGKTGYTDQSGTTLVTYAKRDGMTLIAVVLQSNGTNVYNDTKALLDFGFNNFSLKNVSENDKRFDSDKNIVLKSPFCDTSDLIYIDKTSTVVLPKDVKFSQLTSKVNFNYTNDSFATITYSLGDKSVGNAKVKYLSDSKIKTENTSSETTKKTDVVKTDSKNDTTNDNSQSETKPTTSTKNSGLKLSSSFINILIAVIIVIILITLISLNNRRLNRIRNQKRRQNY